MEKANSHPGEGNLARQIMALCDRLAAETGSLSFAAPVHTVYNPLVYAREPFRQYVDRYLAGRGRVLWLGMNPGPFGMAQTGIPFGAIPPVRDWMGISAPVGQPPAVHPKRPVNGFDCSRIEGSGQRLWGLFSQTWPDPADCFARLVVLNYCPLVFMDEVGANLTPDKLPRPEREALSACCDRALSELITLLAPRAFVGVGTFAWKKLQEIDVRPADVPCVQVLHPSPASPRANQDWAGEVLAVLQPAGLWP